MAKTHASPLLIGVDVQCHIEHVAPRSGKPSLGSVPEQQNGSWRIENGPIERALFFVVGGKDTSTFMGVKTLEETPMQ
jgi:hypothetical protein